MTKTKLIEWVLRIAVAGEFIGHGVFALQGKQARLALLLLIGWPKELRDWWR